MKTHTVSYEREGRIAPSETIPRWSRRARLALGVLTFTAVGVFALTAFIMAIAMVAVPDASTVGPYIPAQFVLILATVTLYMLMLFYISFVSQNPRVQSRGAWVAAMVLMPWVALPMYWHAHVWGAPYVADPSRDHPVPGRRPEPQIG